MKTTILTSIVICACCTGVTMAQDHHDSGAAQSEHESAGPVNKMCPIGKEPVEPEGGSVKYKGDTIGFCCPGCEEKFMAWDEAKRDEFVAAAKADSHMGMDTDHHSMPTKAASIDVKSQPYTLGVCPVSGEALGGDMGEPIVKVIDGREVKFCCKKCVSKFMSDKEGFFAKIDQQMIVDQMPYYPMTTCIVSGESLMEDGEDISVNMIYANRLVRLCCKMCKKEFNADPASFLAKIDKAAADQQREEYPLKTCLVSGEELGGMGEPSEKVIAGRLVKFCCSMCEPKVLANPEPYLKKIDEAWDAANP